MTRYDKGAECNPAEVPGMLACVVANYLKDSPYPGTIRAQINSGWHYTLYLVLLKNDTLDVYRHVERATRVAVQEHPDVSAPPPAKGEA